MGTLQGLCRVRSALAGVAVASLALIAACGSGSAGSGGSSAADTVTIGGLWAETGPQAAYGTWYANGAKMAVDEINAVGGISGKTKIVLNVQDSKAMPEPAVLAFQKMLGDKVPFVLSSFSSQTLALMPIANSKKVVVVNGGAQSDALGKAGAYLFNVIPLLKNEDEVLAKYLATTGGAKKAAIIHTGDDGGLAAEKDFEEAFKAAGGQVVGVESAAFGATDYRSQLTKLRSSGADVLVIGAYGQDSNNIISQVREIGWDVKLANTSWVAIPSVLANKAAEGLTATQIPFQPTAEFRDAYQKKYGEAPTSAFIGNYYDAVKIFAKGYEKAAASGKVTGESLAKAIKEIGTFDSSYGSQLTFDKQQVASRPIDVAVIKGGKFETVAGGAGR